MKKKSLELTPEQYRLACFAVGFAQGRMREECQFPVADALTRLGKEMAGQQEKFLLPRPAGPAIAAIAIRKTRTNE